MVRFSLFFVPSFLKFLFLGSLNLDEDCQQAKNYLTNTPRKQQNRSMTDKLAQHFMYTSAQQAAFDEVPWGKIIYLINLFLFQIK